MAGTKALPASEGGSVEVDPAEYSECWEQMWEAGLEPGQKFDVGASAKALVDLISRPGATNGLDVTGKRVLVPGCGRGYDVVTFSKAGAAEAVGLELSQTAAVKASEYVGQALASAAAGSASVIQADFFKHVPDTSAPYDIGYDYTFGCAMHPSMRKDWASSWAKSIAPGGELVTLIFPLDPTSDPDIGPPFPISPELFTSLLVPAGFDCFFSEPVPAEMSFGPRVGKEWLARWRRRAD